MSSIENVLKEKHEYGHASSIEFNCPVVVKDRILKRMESSSKAWATASIVSDAAESVDLVSRFETLVEYIDFFPQVFIEDKMVTLALRIKFVGDPKASFVVIDFSSTAEEGKC